MSKKCPDCKEEMVPAGSVTGLCYNCEAHANNDEALGDMEGDF